VRWANDPWTSKIKGDIEEQTVSSVQLKWVFARSSSANKSALFQNAEAALTAADLTLDNAILTRVHVINTRQFRKVDTMWKRIPVMPYLITPACRLALCERRCGCGAWIFSAKK